MKLQKLIILSVGLLAGTAGAATQKATVVATADQKKKDQHSAFYHFARMVIAGSISGILAGVAVHGFDDLMKTPYGLTRIDENKAIGDKNSYLGGYPAKVLFPITGALGVWLYCYFTNKDKGCMDETEEADVLAGLPKKEVQEAPEGSAHCQSCSCSHC